MADYEIVERPAADYRFRGGGEVSAIIEASKSGKAVLIQLNGRKSLRNNLHQRLAAAIGLRARGHFHTRWTDATHTAILAWLDQEPDR